MAAYTSTQNGNWSDTATWGGSGPPILGDTATISHVVTVDTDSELGTSPDSNISVINIREIDGGLLILAEDQKLTCRGSIQYTSGASRYNTCFRMVQGSHLEFNTSSASTPSSTTYRINQNSGNSQAPISEINGTASKPCKMSVAGGGNMLFWADFTGCGNIRASYCEFDDTGAILVNPINVSDHQATFDHCTWTRCKGRIWANTAGGALNTITIQNCKFVDTDAISTLNIEAVGVSSLTTGARDISNCVFDRSIQFTTGADNWTIKNNYIFAYIETGGTVGPTFQDNLMVTPGGGAPAFQWDISNCMFFKPDSNIINPHYAGASGSNAFSNLIFGQTGNNESGDCILFDGGSSACTLTNCLTLPNPDRAGTPGTLYSALGGASTTITCENNTSWGAPGSIGETYDGHVGMLASHRNNLHYYPISEPGNHKCLAFADVPQDAADAASLDHNGGFNTTGDYQGFTFSSGTPGVNDIDADPQFVDSTRNLPTYDTSFLGNPAETAWASGQSYTKGQVVSSSVGTAFGGEAINYRCINDHTSLDGDATNGRPYGSGVTDWDTNWEFMSAFRLREDVSRIVPMFDWIRAGFAPRNTAYQSAGYDGSDIGAVPVAATVSQITATNIVGSDAETITWTEVAPS